MKEKKELNGISVKLFRVENDLAPFVMVSYVDKNDHEFEGLMLLDTGSMDNILFCEMANIIREKDKLHKSKTKILTTNGNVIEAENVKLHFNMGGKGFYESFCLTDSSFAGTVGKMPPIIGILGIKFMMNHKLALDFTSFSLHTSESSPASLTISDCSYFFPMQPGLTNCGLPVISMHIENREIIALPDTGASNNVISEKVFNWERNKWENINEKTMIDGIAGSVESKIIDLKFELLTLTENSIEEKKYNDYFLVIPHYLNEPSGHEFIDCNKALTPIGALISSPFMAKEGWVIDFGAAIIYKCK